MITDLKELICTPPMMKTQDVGIHFIITLLQRLFNLFGMGGLEVAPAGCGYDVNYVLLKNRQRYHFLAIPTLLYWMMSMVRDRYWYVLSKSKAHLIQTPKTVYTLWDNFWDTVHNATPNWSCASIYSRSSCDALLAWYYDSSTLCVLPYKILWQPM